MVAAAAQSPEHQLEANSNNGNAVKGAPTATANQVNGSNEAQQPSSVNGTNGTAADAHGQGQAFNGSDPAQQQNGVYVDGQVNYAPPNGVYTNGQYDPQQQQEHQRSTSESRSRMPLEVSRLIPCKFFATGNCRNGNDCAFLHDPSNLAPVNGMIPPPVEGAFPPPPHGHMQYAPDGLYYSPHFPPQQPPPPQTENGAPSAPTSEQGQQPSSVPVQENGMMASPEHQHQPQFGYGAYPPQFYGFVPPPGPGGHPYQHYPPPPNAADPHAHGATSPAPSLAQPTPTHPHAAGGVPFENGPASPNAHGHAHLPPQQNGGPPGSPERTRSGHGVASPSMHVQPLPTPYMPYGMPPHPNFLPPPEHFEMPPPPHHMTHPHPHHHQHHVSMPGPGEGFMPPQVDPSSPVGQGHVQLPMAQHRPSPQQGFGQDRSRSSFGGAGQGFHYGPAGTRAHRAASGSNGVSVNGGRRNSNAGSFAPSASSATVAIPIPSYANGHSGHKPPFAKSRMFPFDPTLPKGEKPPCVFFPISMCKHGDGCMFGHPLDDGSDARALGKGWCGPDGATEKEAANNRSTKPHLYPLAGSSFKGPWHGNPNGGANGNSFGPGANGQPNPNGTWQERKPYGVRKPPYAAHGLSSVMMPVPSVTAGESFNGEEEKTTKAADKVEDKTEVNGVEKAEVTNSTPAPSASAAANGGAVAPASNSTTPFTSPVAPQANGAAFTSPQQQFAARRPPNAPSSLPNRPSAPAAFVNGHSAPAFVNGARKAPTGPNTAAKGPVGAKAAVNGANGKAANGLAKDQQQKEKKVAPAPQRVPNGDSDFPALLPSANGNGSAHVNGNGVSSPVLGRTYSSASSSARTNGVNGVNGHHEEEKEKEVEVWSPASGRDGAPSTDPVHVPGTNGTKSNGFEGELEVTITAPAPAQHQPKISFASAAAKGAQVVGQPAPKVAPKPRATSPSQAKNEEGEKKEGGKGKKGGKGGKGRADKAAAAPVKEEVVKEVAQTPQVPVVEAAA